MIKTTVNREHKSNLFAMIFSDRENALSLYNSINGTDYQDPQDLEFNTIGDVVYMGMKNDVSFLFGGDMNLYESQSTWNPNMPLRGLFYFSMLYQAYVKLHRLNIYSKVRLSLPLPKYVVFYNGTSKEPDYQQLRLSDSFVPHQKDGAPPCVECIAHVLNINAGHNGALMDGCRKLYEYSYLVAAIRSRLARGLTLSAAADEAVLECIASGVLEEFLIRHRSEVRQVILMEYDEELHISSEKALSYQEGFQKGAAQGISQGSLQKLIQQVCRKMAKAKSPESIAEELEEDMNTIRRICDAAAELGPDCDCDQIYQLLQKEEAAVGGYPES